MNTQAMVSREREFAFTDKDFQFIASMVHQATGIVLAEHKRDMVYSRLSRRLRNLGYQTFKEYIELLSSPSTRDAEIGNLVNAITTNLTSFFREGHHFEHLRTHVIEPIIRQPSAGGKRLRIWSAGCSSGAEPYSIAMVLAACLENQSGWDAKILATDIDTNMLERGQSGIYRVQDLKNIPEPYRRYCRRMKRSHEEGVLMEERIRSLVHFRRLNLLADSWPINGPFDVIFCRNVVIYFDKDTQRTLFDRYAKLMKPKGYLYIGHSENLFKVTDRFKLIGKTIYQKAE